MSDAAGSPFSWWGCPGSRGSFGSRFPWTCVWYIRDIPETGDNTWLLPDESRARQSSVHTGVVVPSVELAACWISPPMEVSVLAEEMSSLEVKEWLAVVTSSEISDDSSLYGGFSSVVICCCKSEAADDRDSALHGRLSESQDSRVDLSRSPFNCLLRIFPMFSEWLPSFAWLSCRDSKSSLPSWLWCFDWGISCESRSVLAPIPDFIPSEESTAGNELYKFGPSMADKLDSCPCAVSSGVPPWDGSDAEDPGLMSQESKADFPISAVLAFRSCACGGIFWNVLECLESGSCLVMFCSCCCCLASEIWSGSSKCCGIVFCTWTWGWSVESLPNIPFMLVVACELFLLYSPGFLAALLKPPSSYFSVPFTSNRLPAVNKLSSSNFSSEPDRESSE